MKNESKEKSKHLSKSNTSLETSQMGTFKDLERTFNVLNSVKYNQIHLMIS